MAALLERNCSMAASICASAATKFVIATARLREWWPVPTGSDESRPALTMIRSTDP